MAANNGDFIELEELLKQPLGMAIERILGTYRTTEDVLANRKAILDMEEVKTFIRLFDAYKQHGDYLVNDNLAWILLNYFQRMGPSEVRHIHEVTATCLNHGAPKTVAKAFIRQRKVEECGGLEASLSAHIFRHSDLVYSHHDELIEYGKILCRECRSPATLYPESKIHELVPSVTNKMEVEEQIIEKIARLLRNGTSANFAELKKKVKKEFKQALGIGNEYGTIYDAFEQTRFYAVVLSDVVRNADFTQLDVLRKPLKDPEFIFSIENIIAKHIQPPVIVIGTRIKGQSFADKVLLRDYERALNEDLKNGKLVQYLSQKGISERDEYRFGIGDLIGIMAIVHGDAVSYFAQAGSYEMPKEEQKAQDKVYELVAFMLRMDPEKFRGLNPKERVSVPLRCLDILEVKDYIQRPKNSGYMACHIILESTYLETNFPIRFELQAKTNFMDTLAELSDRQNHDNRKLEQRALIDYLVENHRLNPRRVATYRMLLSPSQRYL